MERKQVVDHQATLEFFIKLFNFFLVLLFGFLSFSNFTGPKADSNNWVIFLVASISMAALTYGLHKRFLIAWGLHATLITGVTIYYKAAEPFTLELWLDLLIFMSVVLQLVAVYNVFKSKI